MKTEEKLLENPEFVKRISLVIGMLMPPNVSISELKELVNDLDDAKDVLS